MMYGSLLSMYNKEMVMILDSFSAIYALRAVHFSLQFQRVFFLSPCDPQDSTLSVRAGKTMKVSDQHLLVPIIVRASSQHLHLSELEFLKHPSISIKIVPLFFSIVFFLSALHLRAWT